MKTDRNYRIFFLVAVICIAMLLSGFSVNSANADGYPVGSIAYVNADTRLNLRAEPQGTIIGDLAHGKTVTILSNIDRNGYYYIRVNQTGQECYAYGEYLTLQETGTQPAKTEVTTKPSTSITTESSKYKEGEILFVVSKQELNLRKKPSRKADRIIYMHYGDKIQVISSKVQNNYLLVKDLSTGKVGYVDTSYIDFELEESSSYEICQCSCEACQGCLRK